MEAAPIELLAETCYGCGRGALSIWIVQRLRGNSTQHSGRYQEIHHLHAEISVCYADSQIQPHHEVCTATCYIAWPSILVPLIISLLFVHILTLVRLSDTNGANYIQYCDQAVL